MWNRIVKLRTNKRFLLLSLALGVVLVLSWQNVRANAVVNSFPAQVQVDQIVPSLISSEAEHASGAYVPGLGAVFVMDLVRGPNSTKGRLPPYGVRDWTIYLMQTFGPQLSAVPPTETIAFSIEYYDYTYFTYHHYVLTSKAADVADPTKYTIWLDGQPFAQAAPPEPTNTVPASTQAAGQKSTPGAAATPAAPNKTKAPASVVAPIGPSPTGVGFKIVTPTGLAAGGKSPTNVASTVKAPTGAAPTVNAPTPAASAQNAPTPGVTGPIDIAHPTVIAFNLADPATGNDWKPLNGQWAIDATGYAQSQLGIYDLITYYSRSITGNYDFQVDMQYVAGQMGGGIVFNSQSLTGKNGAQMISYTASGKYLQWGYFDDNGIFQYQSGAPAPNGADGKNHHLLVRVRGNQYSVLLDGVAIGKGAQLWRPNGGYVGLLASTSQVIFNNAKLEQLGP